MDVVRYLLAVRATGPRGEAAVDLTPGDFVIEIAGRPAEVEAAEWIGAESPAAITPTDQPQPIAGGRPMQQTPARRSVVFFVQTDFGRASQRLSGQMKFNAVAPQIVSMFRKGDRVAVVSHDSHLKIALDFSTDSNAIVDAIRKSIFIRDVPPPEKADGASLLAALDAQEMKCAATGEAALLLVARALSQIEGEKVLVLAGWGFGDYKFGTPWIFYEPECPVAIPTLQSNHIPVISLGTGMGGQLTAGLVSAAQQTGGFFASTQLFVHQGMRVIDTFMEGRYELVLRLSMPLLPGEHPVKATSKRRGTKLQAPEKVIVFAENPPMVADSLDAEAPSPGELFTEAMRLLLDGNGGPAEEMLTEVVAANPEYAEAWYERGMLRAGRDDRVGAAADLRRYLKLAPRGPHAADARELLASLPGLLR